MTYDEIKKSFDEASELFRQARYAATTAVEKIVRNNLRNMFLNFDVLDDLKRELRHWDMNLHKWK
jgi:hypothetical protein